MEVIKQCRDCKHYIPYDFKCNLVTGYAHMPKDYCMRKGHVIDIPNCVSCKFYDCRQLNCTKLNKNFKPYDFCSYGEYKD